MSFVIFAVQDRKGGDKATMPGKKVAKKATSKKAPSGKRAAKKAGAKKRVAKKAGAKKAPAGKLVKKTAAKKAVVKKSAAKKAAEKQSPAKKVVAKKPARKARPRRITPQQALANTRALLGAKHEHDRETPPWRALDTPQGQAPQPGFQSEQALTKAGELHAAESRMQAIQGSIGSSGRHNQGKRDSR